MFTHFSIQTRTKKRERVADRLIGKIVHKVQNGGRKIVVIIIYAFSQQNRVQQS